MSSASCFVFSEAGAEQRKATILLDLAALEPGELLVRVDAATVCGSDVHTVDGKRVDPAAPLVLGHEGCGTVVAGGTEDDARAPISVGQRVTWSVMASCGACTPCARLGLPQKCATALHKYGHASFGVGLRALSGCYSTHILLRRGTCVVRLPDGVPDAVAAPANCALATMCAATRAARRALGRGEGGVGGVGDADADALRGARVLVQGCGLLGLYACALARAAGAAFVAATDVSPARLDLARRFGAHCAVSIAAGAGGPGPETQLRDAGAASAGADEPFIGFDAVFEVCGVVSAVRQALQLLRPGGALVLVGLVHPQSDLAGVTGEAIIRKCASVVGVHNYAPRDLRRAVDFLAANIGTLPLADITSPPMPLGALEEAFEIARTGRYARVLVMPQM
jgi:putative phosphonate catabolism associated alcohol dehydrogenase